MCYTNQDKGKGKQVEYTNIQANDAAEAQQAASIRVESYRQYINFSESSEKSGLSSKDKLA